MQERRYVTWRGIIVTIVGGGINNTQIVTEEGKYALDAVQNNPEIEGSLRNELEAISTNTKGYYKIGPFYVYRYWTNDKTTIKIDKILTHNVIFFFGEQNDHAFNGTVTGYFEPVINKGSGFSMNVVIDTDKIVFNLAAWSSIFLISSCPLTEVEIY